MQKSVYARSSRRLPLQIAVLTCFAIALLAQLALWQNHWTAWLPQSSAGHILFLLRRVADALTVLACGCACFVLGQLAWIMRRQTVFSTAAVGLLLVIGIEGAKRLFDAFGYGAAPGETQRSIGLLSLVLTGGVSLLLPML